LPLDILLVEGMKSRTVGGWRHEGETAMPCSVVALARNEPDKMEYLQVPHSYDD
jgi:hypothetical protein